MPKQASNDTVNAHPTKRFFVQMLVRDIELDDALLDLLDNCVDGVLRQTTQGKTQGDTPYAGFKAELSLSDREFSITDNCGGIDLEIAKNYAFMMGRPDDKRDADIPTVGMYGIGMKRAIFKIGREAKVVSITKDAAFTVTIDKKWLTTDDEWDLPLKSFRRKNEPAGTSITIGDLYPSVREAFAKNSDFVERLRHKAATHFSFIIQKGFEILINKRRIEPEPLRLLLDTRKDVAIKPYMYEGVVDGVNVELFVGLYEPNPPQEEQEHETVARRRKDVAGWTIVCNDRVVVYCDKTRLTGWGEADVPNFHPQFNAIAGVVHFKSNDAFRLPITTTKRGIDASSNTYLYVKDYMREGTKIFTAYTNKWKGDLDRARSQESKAAPVLVNELKTSIPADEWKNVRSRSTERRYTPTLPVPPRQTTERIIRYSKPIADIKSLGKSLLDDPNASPADVGIASFDFALRKS